MNKLNVAVLMGGISPEHEVSLDSGKEVVRFLNRAKYNVLSVIVSKEGGWQVNERSVPKEKILRGVDVVFNALHGGEGEDGRIQGFLEVLGIPFTGSGVLASALSIDKHRSKKLFRYAGLKTSKDLHLVHKSNFFEGSEFRNLMNRFVPPAVAKPVSCGSSIGVNMVSNRTQLREALEEAFSYDKNVLLEELIDGYEVTCGLLENWQDEKIYALPPMKIQPRGEAPFFDYRAKYTPELVEENIITDWPTPLIKDIQETAKNAHIALGCQGYSRVDMILQRTSDQRKNPDIYVLEVNTLPGLTKNSLFPKAAKGAGMEMANLLDQLINTSLKRA